VKQLFESEIGKSPSIEKCELSGTVGRRLIEEAGKKLFAAEQTQTVAILAALIHLNRSPPVGGARPGGVGISRSVSVLQLAERVDTFKPNLRAIASSAAVLEGVPEVSTPTNLEISQKEFPGLVWRGPLAPRDELAKAVTLNCVHAHASVFQQLRRFPISRLLEKILHLYTLEGCWSAPLLSETVSGRPSPLSLSCAVCGLKVLGLFFVCGDCGHGGHLSHLAKSFKSNRGRCALPNCACICRPTRN